MARSRTLQRLDPAQMCLCGVEALGGRPGEFTPLGGPEVEHYGAGDFELAGTDQPGQRLAQRAGPDGGIGPTLHLLPSLT